MPTLDWIGKTKVINHHQDVPFRMLERKYSFDESGQHDEDNGSENMIIHGDNLDALKSLLPRYEGRVKCIYIDPPYNTAHSTDDNRRWVYNDNVDSPEIKKWIGKVVGDEGEDLSRHDKWLCMMYPRLKLLQRLLSEDGIIFISISDVEHAHLRMLCDEIFGSRNFVSNIIWQNNFSPRNDAKDIAYVTDNILAYSKNPDWHPQKLARSNDMDARYTTPDNDPAPWTSSPAHAPGARTHKGMVYAIQHPYTGELFYPPADRHWAQEQVKMLQNMRSWADYKLEQIDDAETRAGICGDPDSTTMPEVKAILLNEPVESSREKVKQRVQMGLWPTLYFTSNGKGGMRVKKYLNNMEGKVVTTLWPYEEVGSNTEAKNELKKLFGGSVPFDTPKPERLIERILQIVGDENMLVLDSFAGSGTTAHAVLKMNAEGCSRRFILIETMDYADNLTAERVKRVITGYGTGRQAIKGTGGNFSYYELGEPLMVGGNLNEAVGTERIREYVWYMETKQPYMPTTDPQPYLLGKLNDTAYYFYYNPGVVTTLDYTFLSTLTEKMDNTVIYADRCSISEKRLNDMGIIFKKIPRDISKL